MYMYLEPVARRPTALVYVSIHVVMYQLRICRAAAKKHWDSLVCVCPDLRMPMSSFLC